MIWDALRNAGSLEEVTRLRWLPRRPPLVALGLGLVYLTIIAVLIWRC